MRIKGLAASLFLILATAAMPAFAATDLATAIQKQGGNYKQALTAFYTAHPEPLWLNGDKPERGSRQIIALFKNSVWHGMNPARYGTENFDALEADPALFEVAMSRAVIQYVRDMTGPRINPARIGLDSGTWLKPPGPDVILTTLSTASDKSDVVEKVAPQGKTYQKLQKELQKMVKAQQEPAQQVIVPFLGVKRVGDTSPEIGVLRQKLGVDTPSGQDPNTYDDTLAREVQKLQASYGLTPDGIIGSRTIRMVNASGRARLEQVIANLEWMRWIDASTKGKAIIVNIPAMHLWAINNNKVEHEMSVVVGRPDRPTPVFATHVTGVRFNPNWTMPMRIKQEDYLPKLQKDPLALTAKGISIMRVTDEGTESVAPDTVDWNKVTPDDLKTLRFVQKPGSNNALGQVRLLMPNRYDVYLHDTNAPELFGRDGRMQSSGCVRMEKPLEIADFVMEGTEGWNTDRMQAILAAGRTRDIPTTAPVSIFLLYQTIWPADDGDLILGDDIYGLDTKLVAALKDSGQFPPL